MWAIQDMKVDDHYPCWIQQKMQSSKNAWPRALL